ncbi:hypothetical protein SAMN05444673_2576 [Bacillus sp. OV166]|uniref:hypothetical protein n=1 Tax=Bacillus sp. OV166 TaxID=1882763 RepID=UPI000A2AC505|nr:hypothetical protein [Bacillus sp. OV166]SMQ75939.1 hypothetical protein SAMN05444673_2576 [Bacillus sp. OV166]
MTEKKRETNFGALKVKIDVDCSYALKGLKAVTREAKRATEALKELEQQQKNMANTFDVSVIKLDGNEIAKAVSGQLVLDNRRTGRL